MTRETHSRRAAGAFSIVELLASMAIIIVIMLILLQVTTTTQKLWVDGRTKSAQFRESRTAFESMSRQLSQATLNTYWDYEYVNPTANPKVPKAYIRQSDLHFVVGKTATLINAAEPVPTHGIFFQAPIGMVEQTANTAMQDLLNAWGYYISYGSDLPLRPTFLADGKRVKERYRYRLMEYRQPSERFQLFGRGLRDSTSKQAVEYYRWFSGNPDRKVLTDASRPLAENIIALVISPRIPYPKKSDGTVDPNEYKDLAPDYFYDSRELQWGAAGNRQKRTRNQLPPTLMVTMVAIDEASGDRLATNVAPGADPKLIDDKWFASVDKYDADMEAFEKSLLDKRINYRAFTTVVTMRNSKWSDTALQ